jgi:outer membrane protein assembly factor BamA
MLLVIKLIALLTVSPDSLSITAATDSLAERAKAAYVLQRITVRGNHITKERIILRELTFQPGDTLLLEEIQAAIPLDEKKLVNTRLFNSVKIEFQASRNELELLVHVHERWYIFPTPIFELSDRNLNEWWETYHHDLSRVNYGVKVINANMRGRGEKLGLWLQFGFQREIDIKYRFPSFDKKQLQGLSLEYSFAESKNLAYRTNNHQLIYHGSSNVLKTTKSYAASYAYRKSFYNQHQASVHYSSSDVSDSIVRFNPEYFGAGRTRQQYLSIGYSFSSDHRDYVGYPLQGYWLTCGISQYGVGRESDFRKSELNFSFATYWPLRHNFYLSNYTTGYVSTQKKIPYSNYETIGYQNEIIRGFEVYVIEGPASLVNKMTLKKQVLSRIYHLNMPVEQFNYFPIAIYLKSFFDVGIVRNYPGYRVNTMLTNKPLWSVGGGVDIVGFYDIVLRLEYSCLSTGRQGFGVNLSKEF